MKFPKRGESSWKRKRKLNDRIYKKIAKLEEGINDLKKRMMKLHAVFRSTPNKLRVKNPSCFCQNCFETSSKYETTCDLWKKVDLQRKRNPSILSSTSSEKTVKLTENKANIVPDINDHVAAVYDSKVYIDKVLQVDDSNAKV